MPYKKNTDLPDNVQTSLPDKESLDIYREAFNHAWDEYKDTSKRRDPDEDREAVSHKVAWAAVKKKYYKDQDGSWHKKVNGGFNCEVEHPD